ncbi:MAG: MBL fold metallo-hydrolase [Candidatus Bipolaricaulia bacterium]
MAGKETQIDGLQIKWIDHSTVQLKDSQGKVIYIDPFSKVLKGDEEKADLIVSTHPHFDHFDPGAINRLLKPETEVVAKKGCDLGQLKTTKAREIEVGEELEVQGVKIKAVEAYNEHRFRSPGQPFHPKGLGMGVVLEVEGKKLYYAGDTDSIPEMASLKEEALDVAFLPIGGTYTMDRGGRGGGKDPAEDHRPHALQLPLRDAGRSGKAQGEGGTAGDRGADPVTSLPFKGFS